MIIHVYLPTCVLCLGQMLSDLPSLTTPGATEEKVYRDILRRYTDTEAIDQSDLRYFLEGAPTVRGIQILAGDATGDLTVASWKNAL